ncbi:MULTISPECIES: Thoeris anti-defense Tad2 family protein [unclassified Microcystis]|jgi:hypothetical protein
MSFDKTLDFSQALSLLKEGKKIARQKWIPINLKP